MPDAAATPMLEPVKKHSMIAAVKTGGRHNYWILPAQARDCALLANDLRTKDMIEITGSGNNPKRALWRGYRNSVLCRSAFIDGRIAAMWGLCVGFVPGVSLLSDTGRPWLLTTPVIETMPIAFVKEARQTVKEMLALKPVLENAVLASYGGAIRLLEILGFTVDEEIINLTGTHYRRFHMTRADHNG